MVQTFSLMPTMKSAASSWVSSEKLWMFLSPKSTQLEGFDLPPFDKDRFLSKNQDRNKDNIRTCSHVGFVLRKSGLGGTHVFLLSLIEESQLSQEVTQFLPSLRLETSSWWKHFLNFQTSQKFPGREGPLLHLRQERGLGGCCIDIISSYIISYL